MKIVGYQICLRITRFVILVIRPDYQKFCLRSTPAKATAKIIAFQLSCKPSSYPMFLYHITVGSQGCSQCEEDSYLGRRLNGEGHLALSNAFPCGRLLRDGYGDSDVAGPGPQRRGVLEGHLDVVAKLGRVRLPEGLRKYQITLLSYTYTQDMW